jgi:MYXO-CTERM domain-containing protein
MFPDGGYVIEDDYGEMAHWAPFQNAYARWITRTFPKPYSHGDAAAHTAFLFGMASHGMADQVFDSEFMEIARVYDADGWANGLLDGFDTATDVFLVADTGIELVFDSWVPADEIAGVFADDLDYTIDPGALWSAQDLLHRVVLSYVRDTGLNDPSRVAEYRAQYPWASDNIMNRQVQGSPPCEAAVVAAYWQSLWFRMHAEAGPDLVVATVPGDGGAGHPTDSSAVESQLIVVFGDAMDARTVNDSTVTVTDAGGAEQAVSLRFHYGDGTNVLRIEPDQDWTADTDYTVTLAPGIATSDGAELTEPYSFSFSTRAAGAGDILPCTDPTPFTGEPDVGMPPDSPDESGGCSTGGSGAGAALIVLLAAAAVRRRRA